MINALILLISLSCLNACQQPAANAQIVGANVQTSPDGNPRNILIVFADFRRTQATLTMDGRELYRGPLDVADESTALSKSLQVPIAPGRHSFRLISGAVDVTRQLEITPRTQTLLVNPLRRPFIEPSDGPSLLD